MSFLSSKPKASLLDLFKAHPDVEGLGIAADPRVVRMAAQRVHKKNYRSTLDFLARHGHSAVSG